jgi:hypothetical protein
LCIRADGHNDQDLRAMEQEENSPPRRRLLKEDDGKSIEAWAAAACEILSNSKIATIQGVSDCDIALDNQALSAREAPLSLHSDAHIVEAYRVG